MVNKKDNYDVIRQSQERKDVRDKVTGSTVYTNDMYLPGMLIAEPVRCPYPHARIVSMNKEEVLKMPGVRGVITYEDLPDRKFITAGYPKETIPGTASGVPEEYLFDKTILSQELNYAGEIAAVVVADSYESAYFGSQALQIQYEELPYVIDMDEALEEDAPFVHNGSRKNCIEGEIAYGDVEQAFKDADFVFEDEFHAQPQQHACMETCCSIAKQDGSGKITLWSTTQVPYHVRRNISEVLDIPMSMIRVVKPPIGGGFGERQMMINELLVVAIARIFKVPVRMDMTREANLETVSFRHEMKIKLKTGVMKDGTIVGYQMNVRSNAGAYVGHSPYVTRATATKLPYRIPNVRFNCEVVFTNRAESGAFRGYGNPQMTLAREVHMSRVAERLKMDEIEFRRMNLVQVGQPNPVALKSDWILESCGLAECMDKGAEAIGWYKPKKQVQDGSKLYGRGMSAALHVTGTSAEPDFSSAQVKFCEDGTVILLLGSPELGQGSDTTHAQICAETLGVRYEDIFVYSADTDMTPLDMGSYSSRQTYVAGNAVKLAAQKAKDQMIRFGAELAKVKINNLDIRDSWLVRRENGRKLFPLSEVAYYATYLAPEPMYINESASYSSLNCPPAFAAHFCEVEIDTATGEVNVLDFVAAHDVGTAINPAMIEGQIEGSIVQGLGPVVWEDMVYVDGILQNKKYSDYKVPRAQDAPPMQVIIVEAFEPSGPFGAKSVGEIAMAPVAAAIVNAIYDATGVRITSTPLSKDRVLKSLQESGKAFRSK